MTVPLLAVLVVGVATIVSPLFVDADNAASSLARARAGSAAFLVGSALADERDLSVRLLGSDAVDESGVRAARRVTDSRIRALDELPIPTSSPRFSAAIADARTEIDDIDQLRTSVDRESATPRALFESYSQVTTALERVVTAMSDGSTSSDFIAQADSMAGLSSAVNATASLRGYVVARLDGGTLDASAAVTVVEYREALTSDVAAFQLKAGDAQLEAFGDVMADPFVTASRELVTRVITTANQSAPADVGADEWFDAMSFRTAKLDALSVAQFSDFVSESADAVDVARQRAHLSLGAFVTASLLGLLTAVGLGRSLVQRVANVTDGAHEIAANRLPIVLSSLDNPMVADSDNVVPRRFDSATDEFGAMEESFNEALRAAVDSSIEHCRKRADTMTSLVVGLGHRNLALLGRQLDQLDSLEAAPHDAETAAGLSRLSHASIAMRRNIESLVTVASGTAPRRWSEPVKVHDLVAGAILETGQPSRVTTQLNPLDPTCVVGRVAVDLAHILSELIDNAVKASPASEAVVVSGEAVAGGFRLWVTDSGPGLRAQDLDAVNAALAGPRDIEDVRNDQVGIATVGRLARRIGVRVGLHPGPDNGVAARVDIQESLMSSGGSSDDDSASEGPSVPAALVPATTPIRIPEPEPIVGIGAGGTPPEAMGFNPVSLTPSDGASERLGAQALVPPPPPVLFRSPSGNAPGTSLARTTPTTRSEPAPVFRRRDGSPFVPKPLEAGPALEGLPAASSDDTSAGSLFTVSTPIRSGSTLFGTSSGDSLSTDRSREVIDHRPPPPTTDYRTEAPPTVSPEVLPDGSRSTGRSLFERPTDTGMDSRTGAGSDESMTGASSTGDE